jgi:hypothetical protein
MQKLPGIRLPIHRPQASSKDQISTLKSLPCLDSVEFGMQRRWACTARFFWIDSFAEAAAHDGSGAAALSQAAVSSPFLELYLKC